MAGLLFLGNDLCDRNEDFNSEQSNTILIIAGKVLKQRYHFVNHHGYGNFLDEFSEVVRGLSSHHRGLIVNEVTELGSEALLR